MFVKRIKQAGRAIGKRRPPRFEGVPVAFRGASCIAFFKLISFVDVQGGP